MLGFVAQARIMEGDLGLYKGTIYENVIASILYTNGHELYYFEKNSTLEIDFITNIKEEIIPIEVKSADNTRSQSMKSLLNNYNIKKGIKLSSNNVSFKNNILSLPIYLVMFIKS